MATKSPKRRSVRKTPIISAKPKCARVAGSKLDQIIEALRQQKGATLAALMTLTGWQMHSVRGAIAGALKKKRGLSVTSTKVDGERVYRIAGRA